MKLAQIKHKDQYKKSFVHGVDKTFSAELKLVEMEI
jgi:hypothetical protein